MSNELVFEQPQTDVAITFLQDMFSNRWDLAAIPPDGGRTEFQTFDVHEDVAAADWINKRQGVSGLYYHINEIRDGVRNRKATKEDIARVLHLHADIDVNDAVTLQRIRVFTPTPTIIVFSGGGFQPIWTLKEPTTEFERVERINRFIANILGGDNCYNVDRLLRLPGTINMPNFKKRTAGRVPTLARIV